MQVFRVRSLRLKLRSSMYIVVTALLAAAGFVGHSPWPILFAALLALPASVVALPGYYIAYGVLALVPGANPSSNAGSESVSPDGTVISSIVTGQPTTWFTITTAVLGILALTFAALLNVLLLWALRAWKRAVDRP